MQEKRHISLGHYILVLLGYCLPSMVGMAQPYSNLKFRSYDLRDGLPHNEMSDLGHDAEGYVWVATLGGVCRFDGVQFEYFKVDGSEGLRQSGNFSYATDQLKRFWLGNEGGLAWFDPGAYRFVYPQFGALGDSLQVSGLWFDGQETLWVLANDRLWKIHTPTLRIDSTNLQMRGCLMMTGDSKNRLWFSGVGAQLLRYDINTSVISKWKVSFEALDAYEDNQGMIWFTGSGLFGWNTQTDTYTEFRPPQVSKDELFFPRYLSVFPELTGDSVLWISTLQHGLALFNLRKQSFFPRFIQRNPFSPSSLPANRTSKMMYHKGVLWISTYTGGLVKLDEQDQEFGSMLFPFLEESNAPDINVVCADPLRDDIWWIGNRGSGGLVEYNHAEKKVLRRFFQSLDKSLATTEVRDLLVTADQTLWIGTNNGLFSIREGHLKRNPSNDLSHIVRLSKGNDTHFWVVSEQGVGQVETATGYVKFFTSPEVYKSKFTKPLLDISEDRAGNVWVATFKGLAQLDVATAQWQSIETVEGNGHNMSNWMNDIAYDEKGNLWLATLDGLLYYDTRQHQTKVFSEKEGIPPGTVYQLMYDPSGKLWIFSQYGVFFSEKNSHTFQKLRIPNGFSNEDIRGIRRAVHWINGNFFYSKENFNLYFNPLRVNRNETLAYPLIRRFLVKNQLYPYEGQSVDQHPLILNHDQNFVLFDFTAINYTQSERIQFRYILEGFDNDTTFSDNRRTANYTNLPDGDFVFKVWAANSAGVWNDQPALFHLRILNPWWRTLWFQVLAVLTLLGLTWKGIQWQWQRSQIRAKEREREAHFKQKEAELRHEVSEVKLSALRAQMSPHFVFNCLNSINNYIVMNDSDNASHYLGMFSKLIRRVLDASRTEHVSLEDELETLKLYIELERMRFGNRFDYVIDVQPGLDTNGVILPPMLIQPYVENAIWHGLMHKERGHGLLTIAVQRVEEEILIRIEDNGVGRQKAAALKSKTANQHKSHGMTVTHERLGIINDLYQLDARVRVTDLVDADGNNVGTRVLLRMKTGY